MVCMAWYFVVNMHVLKLKKVCSIGFFFHFVRLSAVDSWVTTVQSPVTRQGRSPATKIRFTSHGWRSTSALGGSWPRATQRRPARWPRPKSDVPHERRTEWSPNDRLHRSLIIGENTRIRVVGWMLARALDVVFVFSRSGIRTSTALWINSKCNIRRKWFLWRGRRGWGNEKYIWRQRNNVAPVCVGKIKGEYINLQSVLILYLSCQIFGSPSLDRHAHQVYNNHFLYSLPSVEISSPLIMKWKSFLKEAP